MNELTHHSTTPTKTSTQYDYILLDGSGSMQPKWFDMLDAIEAYVTGLQAARTNTHLHLHVFDDFDINLVQRDCAIADWKSLREAPIGSHFTGTPLYDAINLMGRKLRDLDPPRASLLIITDGQDTGSTTDIHQAKSILDWCRAKGWQITFIGAEFNNASQAARLGASPAEAIGVSQRHLVDAAKNLATKRAQYGLYGTSMHFSDDEKQQFGCYLNGPSAK